MHSICKNYKLFLLCWIVYLCLLSFKSIRFKPSNNYFLVREDGLSIEPNAIFFIETSGSGILNSRQACSVESAARAHPHRQVNVIFIKPYPINDMDHVTFLFSCFATENVMCVLEEAGVKFSVADIYYFAKGTPYQKHLSDFLSRSVFPVTHASDALRFFILYKYSGVYLDLDVIVAKSFNTLPKNWVAIETDFHIGSSALSMSDDNIGRFVANQSLYEFWKDVRPDDYVHNGPGVITRLMKRICTTQNVINMTAATCHGFEVIEQKYIYPISYDNWTYFFRPGQILNEPYVYHIWNHYSENGEVHEDSLYQKLAKQFCPNVFGLYQRSFGRDKNKGGGDRPPFFFL